MVKGLSQKPFIISAVLLVLAGLSALTLFRGQAGTGNITAPAYHPSQFPEYAPLVLDDLARQKSVPISLADVMGGVASHHVPTTMPKLAEFYSGLKATKDIKTFVIIGPDHLDKSQGEINVSRASFLTPFGKLEPDLALIGKIAGTGFTVTDEKAFDGEHSIAAQTLFISRVFPDAKIVPIIIKSSLGLGRAEELGKMLAGMTDDSTFVLASVDFSHYLSADQARPVDELSSRVLARLDISSASLIDADSVQTLTIVMSYLKAKGADKYSGLGVFNTKDFSSEAKYTTGYVFGYWGKSK